MESIEQQMAAIKADLNSLQTQVSMMNPAAYIEFKGQVLSTLQSIVKSIDALHLDQVAYEKELKALLDNKDTVLTNISKESGSNSKDIAVIKGQAALIALFISIAVPIIIALVKAYL